MISSHLLEFDRALELGERALELARATGDEESVGRAIDSIKLAVWQLGDLERLEQLTGRARASCGVSAAISGTCSSRCSSRRSCRSAERAGTDADRSWRTRARSTARVRDPLAEVLILDALCWLHRSRGDYEEALSAGRRAVALGAPAERSGWHEATATSVLMLGLCLAADVELAEAVAQLTRAADIADRVGLPAPAWEAHAALARLAGVADAQERLVRSAAIIERISAGIGDEALRAGLRPLVPIASR